MTKESQEIKFDRNMDDELKKLKIQIEERVLEAHVRGLDKLFVDTCNSFNELLLEHSIYQDKLNENFDEVSKNSLKSFSDMDFTYFEKIEKMKSLFYPSLKIDICSWRYIDPAEEPQFPSINFEVGGNKYSIVIDKEKKIIHKSLFMNEEIIFGIAELGPSKSKGKKIKVGIIVYKGDEWVKDFYKILSDFNLVNSIEGDLSDKELEMNKFIELKKNFNL